MMQQPSARVLIGMTLSMFLVLGIGCHSSHSGSSASSAKTITAFSFLAAGNSQLGTDITGTIDEQAATIALAGPLDTADISSLKATFTTTGASVSVAGVTQTSGVTANSFASPVTYRVMAQDGTTKDYTVYVGYWQHPSGLSDHISPAGQNAYFPQVATDNHGNAIIVWYQYDDGSTLQIFKSEYRNGVWTHPASLNDHISPGGQDAALARVAMDDNGNAIIAWYQSDGSTYQIFKSEYRNGTWTNPASLSDNISPDGRQAYDPQVAMGNDGSAIIVWYQDDGSSRNQVFKSEYRGGAWTHPASLSDHISIDGEGVNGPRVAMDNNGNAIITWFQSNGTHYQIFKSEYRNGAWTYPGSLNDNISPDNQDARDPQVAMGDNGDALIVWYQSNGTNEQIFKSEYRNSAWTHPASLNDNISPDGQNADCPQVAMDDNGDAIIVWWQSDGSNQQTFKSENRDGVWTHPASLSDHISLAGTNAYVRQVVMDNNGNAIIVWRQQDGSKEQTFKSEYRGGVWAHPTGLTDNISPDGQDADAQVVAMADNGNDLIVWRQYNGTNEQIFMSEYRFWE